VKVFRFEFEKRDSNDFAEDCDSMFKNASPGNSHRDAFVVFKVRRRSKGEKGLGFNIVCVPSSRYTVQATFDVEGREIEGVILLVLLKRAHQKRIWEYNVARDCSNQLQSFSVPATSLTTQKSQLRING
jgi:hypothetical protein